MIAYLVSLQSFMVTYFITTVQVAAVDQVLHSMRSGLRTVHGEVWTSMVYILTRRKLNSNSFDIS